MIAVNTIKVNDNERLEGEPLPWKEFLKEGDQFVVIGQGDAVIFKAITPPSMNEFRGLLSEAASQAKKAGMKPSAVKAAIRKVRRKK